MPGPYQSAGQGLGTFGFSFLESEISTTRQEEKLDTIYFNLPPSTSSFVRFLIPGPMSMLKDKYPFDFTFQQPLDF